MMWHRNRARFEATGADTEIKGALEEICQVLSIRSRMLYNLCQTFGCFLYNTFL